jgi:predicted 3-demethylubiquinone-9 3-methyltransferase (glyoxalase superfamily)
MTSIATHLMFQDGRAREAVDLYVATVPGSAVDEVTGPDGPGQTIRFRLAGRDCIAFDSPMPHDFDFTPAMSLFVTCDDAGEVDRIFGVLSDGGKVLMPLDDYGFSPRFGWCCDRFGVSWQVSAAA